MLIRKCMVLLFGVLLCSRAVATQAYPEINANFSAFSDYQRMSYLFHAANSSHVQPLNAALHFLQLPEELTEHECNSLRELDGQELATYLAGIEAGFSRQLLYNFPRGLPNYDSFSLSLDVQDAYRRYDKKSGLLFVNALDSLRAPLVVARESAVYPSRGSTRGCDAFQLLFEKSGFAQSNLMPRHYRINLFEALQKSSMAATGSSSLLQQTRQLQKMLSAIPMSAEAASQLLASGTGSANMQINIHYVFRARRPFVETDALGQLNRLTRIRGEVTGFTLPSHSIQVDSIEYTDKRSGSRLAFFTFPLSGSAIEPEIASAASYTLRYVPTNTASVPVDVHSTSSIAGLNQPAVVVPDPAQLLDGLHWHNGAIIVRTDDATARKTTAQNRLAMARLNQLLALSAGLPNLSIVENGIYVADTLGSSAGRYFLLRDLREVQSLNYNNLLHGKNEGVDIAVGWKPDTDLEQLLAEFRAEAVPALRATRLQFPVKFVELREVLLFPYDPDKGGFPLLPVNVDPWMTLTDLRKPSINLQANIPDEFPGLWKVNYLAAEFFIDRYYLQDAGNSVLQSRSRLKRLTLASYYDMETVRADRSRIFSTMRLQRQSLYLDDDLNVFLADLPIPADHGSRH